MNRLLLSLLCSFIVISAVELSSAQTWEDAPSLPNDFYTHHSFGFSIDNMGYLVTGTDDDNFLRDDFYQFDPGTDTWTKLTDFPGGARSFAIGDTWDGKAYFGFGVSATQGNRDLWVFDPSDMSWTELASCPCEPRTHPAFVAHNGKVFLGMGGGTSSGNLRDWWVYDIDTDTWTQGENFPGTVRHHPFQFAIGDYVYAGLGHGNGIFRDFYQYDPSNDTWLRVADIPGEGRVAGTQFSHGGLGFVLSGDGDDHSSMAEGEFWSYDARTDEWTELPPHPSNSRWAPASFVLNDEVYIINGVNYFPLNYGIFETDVFRFDLSEFISSTDNVDFVDAGIALSPNPTDGVINIDVPENLLSADSKLNVFNIEGQLMHTATLEQQNIDLSFLNSGNYLLQIIDNNAHYIEKLVKQ